MTTILNDKVYVYAWLKVCVFGKACMNACIFYRKQYIGRNDPNYINNYHTKIKKFISGRVHWAVKVGHRGGTHEQFIIKEVSPLGGPGQTQGRYRKVHLLSGSGSSFLYGLLPRIEETWASLSCFRLSASSGRPRKWVCDFGS
jgi:hypothetical protein